MTCARVQQHEWFVRGLNPYIYIYIYRLVMLLHTKARTFAPFLEVKQYCNHRNRIELVTLYLRVLVINNG
jgi:hypothetical protein